MSSLQTLRDSLPDYAKDTKLNLGSVLGGTGTPDISEQQMIGTALASAYATRHDGVIAALEGEFAEKAGEDMVRAAKAAATIMAMNNVYYRFVHLAGDSDIKSMPAKLRMNIIGAPGIEKADFELMSMAVSAINGCGMCMEAHLHELVKAGISKQGVQSAVRIGAVINAAAQALSLKE